MEGRFIFSIYCIGFETGVWISKKEKYTDDCKISFSCGDQLSILSVFILLTYFFGSCMTCIEKKSQGLSCYVFTLFFLFFSLKRRKRQRQSFLEKILISLKK